MAIHGYSAWYNISQRHGAGLVLIAMMQMAYSMQPTADDTVIATLQRAFYRNSVAP